MDDDDIPSVVADDIAGVRLAIDHLVELGHTQIAHVAGSLEVSTGQQRFDGFLQAMARPRPRGRRGADPDRAELLRGRGRTG